MISLNISTDRKEWYRISLDSNSNFPLTFSIQDIKDFSKRKGSGSKTITIANTKQNHIALEHVFDVHNDKMRFVKKKCYCQVVQDDVVILDNQYFRIEEAIINDNVITYTAKIFNELTNFYSVLDGKLLTDLDLTKYNHIYNAATIVNSFDNDYTHGYKYILPYDHNTEGKYYTKELFPGIYTRTYFDKIHEEAGYRYKFDQMEDPTIRFNKLIHPFAGDLKKILDKDYNYNSIVNKETKMEIFNVPTINQSTGASSKTSNFVLMGTNFDDPKNLWNNTEYFTVPGTISNPQMYKFEVSLDWDFYIDNILAYPIKNSLASYHITTADSVDIYLEIKKQNGTVLVSKRLTGNIEPNVTTHNGPALKNEDDKYYINGPIYINAKSSKKLLSNHSYVPVEIPITEVTVGDKLKANIKVVYRRNASKDFQWALHTNYTVKVQHEYRVKINKFKIIQRFETESFLVGVELPINKFIPSGIKQTEYLLSLMQMYNLYAEPDKDDEHLIVYKTRDKYYEDGKHIGDYTKYVDFSKDFKIKYLPDVNQKKVILSYKHDNNDKLLKEYKNTTEEVVSEQQIIFDNENVKGEKKQTNIFSPSLNIISTFGASVPYMPADNNMNIKILLDNGKYNCNPFVIRDNSSTFQYSKIQYPHFSMLNHPTEPTFTIEYGTSQYYCDKVERFTNNNLFMNHFYNMFQQMNSGSLVTCYMRLDEAFINSFSLDNRLTINNKEYYINQIIDYNPEITYTKVELISSDDVLKVPRIGRLPGTVIKDSGLVLVDATITIVNTEGTIIDQTFEPNPTDDEIEVEVDNTVADLIHYEKFTPSIGSVVIDNISNTKNPINAIKDNIDLYNSINNINFNGSNTIIGNDNIIQPDVKGSFVYGNNMNVDRSNTYYIDNVVFKNINGIDMKRLEREYSESPYIELTRQEFIDNVIPDRFDINNDQYYITDRDLFIKLYNDGKSEEIWRNIECPAKHYYNMTVQKEIYNNKWTYFVNDIVVYSNKTWLCINPKPSNTNALMAIDLLDPTYFEEYNGDTELYKVIYEYDILTDTFYTATDPVKNNVIIGLNTITDFSMYTDWNNPNMFNNVAGGGIVNNCTYEIKNNNTVGMIHNNVAFKIIGNNADRIQNNETIFEIQNNFINQDLSNNKANRIINNNAHYIRNNVVNGRIEGNILTGYIQNILAADNINHIRFNRCNNIINANSIITNGSIEETPINK